MNISVFTISIFTLKKLILQCFFLSSEFQIYRTNGDVESSELEKGTQSNNQAIDIVQIKGM